MKESSPSRRTKQRITTAIGATTGLALAALAPAPAAACVNTYISASNLNPSSLATVRTDVLLSEPWQDRRAKWNSGNTRLTAISYSYAWVPGIYEVVDINPNDNVARYFTRDHPEWYRFGGYHVDIRVRNKGASGIISPSGQTCT